MNKRTTLAFVFILLTSSVAWSQSFYNFGRQRDIIVHAAMGTSSYFGDLKDPGDVFDPPFNGFLGGQYYFTPQFSIRGELGYFRLRGDDAKSDTDGRVRRNLSFVSNNIELNFVGMINLLPNGRRFYQRPTVNGYLFGGLGFTYFNPRGEVPATYVDGNGVDGNPVSLNQAGEMVALQPLNTEGNDYNRVTLVIPFGGGVRFKAGPFFNIAVEAGYRLCFTDYLDDVSTNYVDQSFFGDDLVARAMADRRPEIGLKRLEPDHIRGDPSHNDGYMLLSIRLEYYLPAHILSTGKIQQNRRRPGRPRGQ